MSRGGLLSFSNCAFVLSIWMMACGTVWLLGLYDVFEKVRIEMVEIALYVGCVGLILRAPKWFGDLAHWWGALATLGLTGATILTLMRLGKMEEKDVDTFNLVNMTIYGLVGWHLRSTLICSGAVLFLMLWLEFKMVFGPGFILVGYDDAHRVASATLVSGLVTVGGSILKLKFETNLFAPGMLWFGSFVFFLSLLIVSSSMYCSFWEHNYSFHNWVALISYGLALFGGNYCDISQIRGFGGTFAVLWLLEKYFEFMPATVKAWAWATFFLGLIGFGINMYGRVTFGKYFNPMYVSTPLSVSSGEFEAKDE